jgi:hypothetical protein
MKIEFSKLSFVLKPTIGFGFQSKHHFGFQFNATRAFSVFEPSQELEKHISV